VSVREILTGTRLFPPDAEGVPGLLWAVAASGGSNPASESVPWVDGPLVVAGDGSIFAWMPARLIPPATLAFLPRWDPRRPRGVVEAAREAGPYSDRPVGLPDDAARPRLCGECGGRGATHREGRHSVCPRCAGRGHEGRSFRVAPLLPAGDGWPGVGIDSWHAAILRHYGAAVYPPLKVRFDRIGSFRFTVDARGVEGVVAPAVVGRNNHTPGD
jgi:hypothetical protein